MKRSKRSPNSRASTVTPKKWPKERRRAAARALVAARDLIRCTGELAKGELAWSADGREVSPLSAQAAMWCSLGAICCVTRSEAYGAAKPMRRTAKDALYVLGRTYDRNVRSVHEAATAVFELNDGQDNGQARDLSKMSVEKHFAYVLETFEKAEKALR